MDWITFQTAVFQGNVYAQNVNNHGFRWRLDSENGYFFLNEAQFRWNHRDIETGLPGQFKAGGWYHTARFDEPDSDSSVRGNYGFYFILDQMLYREPAKMAENMDAERKSGKSASASRMVPVPPPRNRNPSRASAISAGLPLSHRIVTLSDSISIPV